jgi:hypothetical protein
MAATESGGQSNQSPQSFGQRAKCAGLYLLFGTILVIPRIRRLRRRVWAWTLVRLGISACGVWLVWRYAHLRSGPGALAGGVLLLALGLLVRSKPVEKSVDSIANELGALIVLNGGTFLASPDAKGSRRAQIFVQSEGVIICDHRNLPLTTIPHSKFRSLAARPSTNGARNRRPAWEVEIVWEADGPRTSKFLYQGPFAEHLAQVTESTLRTRWKKELPVLK